MAALLPCLLLAASVHALDVVPAPRVSRSGSSAASVRGLQLRLSCEGEDCAVLRRAAERARTDIFRPPGSTGGVFRQSIFEDRMQQPVPQSVHPLQRLDVQVLGQVSAPAAAAPTRAQALALLAAGSRGIAIRRR
jgi:hypothetical protein